MLQKFGRFIVKARYWFFGLFLLLAVASVFLMQYVGVNYNIVEYLPDDSKTKISIEVMEEEFGSSGTASVMISGVTKEQATSIASDIANVEGVASAIFDADNSSYYNSENQKALIKVFLTDSDYSLVAESTLQNIETLLNDESYALSGSAVTAVNNRNAVGGEMSIILLVAVLIVLVILFLTSKSYMEPLIFLIVIGVAILINMGTNIFLGEISFITKSISSVMLIALEMDYSIVLLHRFREEKQKNGNSLLAMEKAISGSFMAVISSSFTVMAGLIALMFMDFSIGFDIGMVLAKGVFISVLAVIFFMPAVILMFDNLIEKTTHRSFLPNMKKVGTFAKKTRFVMPIIFLCLIVAAVCLQGNVNFTYVVQSGTSDSKVAVAERQVEEYFGKQNPLVVMLDKDDIDKQKQVANYIISYTDEDGNKIINSSSALVLSSAYDKMYAEDIANLGLSTNSILAIYETYGKDYTSDYIYKIDVVKYLIQNESVLKNDLTETITKAYASFFTPVTQSSAKSDFALTDEQVEALYNGEVSKPICMVATYIVENNLTACNSFLVQSIYQKANQAFTAQDLVEKFALSQEQVAGLFQLMGKNVVEDSIKFYELVNVLNNNENLFNLVMLMMHNSFVSASNLFDSSSNLLTGENYARLIFNINLSDDDEVALKFVNDLEAQLTELCGENNFHIVSNSYNIVGMQNVFSSDKLKTDLITIIAIILILLIAFRSISIPLLLVLIIQGAIWINLGITVLDGTPVFFVCYLLAMAIQMGATIDYGILLTDRYVFARRKENKFEAIKTAIDKSFVTVITSGLILVLACFTIHFLSSMPLISDIGLLIGRGALISIITILFVLPQCLLVFDKLIEKTTLKTKFVLNTIGTQSSSDLADSGANEGNSSIAIDEARKNQEKILQKQEQDLKQLSEIEIDDNFTSKLDELREKGKENKKKKKDRKN